MITKKEYNSRIKQYNTKIKIALEDNEKYDAIMYEQELKDLNSETKQNYEQIQRRFQSNAFFLFRNIRNINLLNNETALKN